MSTAISNTGSVLRCAMAMVTSLVLASSANARPAKTGGTRPAQAKTGAAPPKGAPPKGAATAKGASHLRAAPRVHDIVIYGGTSAAVTAAVQAKRMNKTVVILEPGQHLGGLTTGGLGATDIGNKGAIGGLARNFYEEVHAHYANADAWKHQERDEYLKRAYKSLWNGLAGDPVAEKKNVPAMWTFEPAVAETILRRWLDDAEVQVIYGAQLDRETGVVKRRNRIVSVRMKDGRVFHGRIFIDATYEGDLFAAAGVSYHVGREANTTHGETLNGVQTARALSHNFTKSVDPYVVPGDPASGLLPGIQPGTPEPDGAGDRRVQAYNFRMTVTDAAENRLPIPKPPGYDPARYELLRRYISVGVFDALRLNTAMPNRKTDINNKGAFSSDHIGGNHAYPEADDATRALIIEDHKNYVMGMWYFLQNDPRLPEDVRKDAGKWGLCKDEYLDTGHWPHALYVREGRRMISEYVMTEHNCTGKTTVKDSVGLGAYGMDSHNVQRYARDGRVWNEGDVQVPVAGPYPIAFRSIIPKRKETENLLVPVSLSATHIAFGSIRMEPVFMMLGQSAATAAAMSLDNGVPLHRVPYKKLRRRLLQDGQVLDWTAPAAAAHASH